MSEYSCEPLTTKEILKTVSTRTDDRISQKIQEYDLTELAKCLEFDGPELKEFMNHEKFGLGVVRRTYFRYKHTSSEDQIKALLGYWIQNKPNLATFEELVRILAEKEKATMAMKVCEYVAKRKSKPETKATTWCTPSTKVIPVLVVAYVLLLVVVFFILNRLHATVTPLSSDLVLTDFKKHKLEGSHWLSHPIYTHPQGYKICLAVVANGAEFGKETHVSVFIYLMRGEFDDFLQWPFQGTIYIRLVDQLSGVYHKEDSLSFDDKVDEEICSRVIKNEVAMKGWGLPRFIPYDDIKPYYLQNDSLIFQIYKVEFKDKIFVQRTSHIEIVDTYSLSVGQEKQMEGQRFCDILSQKLS